MKYVLTLKKYQNLSCKCFDLNVNLVNLIFFTSEMFVLCGLETFATDVV